MDIGRPAARIVRNITIWLDRHVIRCYDVRRKTDESIAWKREAAMLKITICVGSSCSVRGSDDVAATLEELIAREGLEDKLMLVGAFCMEQCSGGVSVRVGDRVYREMRPADVEPFFYHEVIPLVRGEEQG